MTTLRSRIAPTPSGYLHLGNLANFLYAETLTAGGELGLRIDDCDGTRARPEFVEHVFAVLGWLGLQWTFGPRDATDFARGFSQVARKEYYRERLRPLAPLTYACDCSRKDVAGIYPGTCREKGIAFEPGRHALRLRVEDSALAASFGDPVLWRKDDGPAYQWVSVVDDLDQGITLIVRGEDLRASSELQKYLARLVAPDGLDGARFVHHPLLTGPNGKKLSKTERSESVLDLMRKGVSSAELRERLVGVIRGWEAR